MYCSNCGHQLNEGQKFCSNCGVSVSVEKISNGEVSEGSDSVVEESKDFAAKEIFNLIKIVGICLVLALIAIPIGMEDNMDYAVGAPAGGGLEHYIESNKTAHMKKLFMNTFIYSLIIMVVGRYLLLIVNWANKRQTNKT